MWQHIYCCETNETIATITTLFSIANQELGSYFEICHGLEDKSTDGRKKIQYIHHFPTVLFVGVNQPIFLKQCFVSQKISRNQEAREPFFSLLFQQCRRKKDYRAQLEEDENRKKAVSFYI